MTEKILIFLCLVTSCLFSTVSYASNDDHKSLAGQKAQKAIDACWAISEEDRAGSTSSAIAGILDSALCMEDHIIELSEKYLFPDSPDLVSETKKNLEEIRSGYGRLYWNLYNEHDRCVSLFRCGTQHYTADNSAYAHILEDILFDFYKQIEEYELDVEKPSYFGDKEVLIKVNDSQTSLKMPEQYLGYWGPRSRGLAGVGIDVQAGIIWHKGDPEYYNDIAPENLSTRYQDNYKVFYIDNNPNSKFTDQYVYAIVKHQITLEWLRYTLEHTGIAEEEIEKQLKESLIVSFQYYRFAINIPYPKSFPNDRNLGIGDVSCDLTEKDWLLPLHIHRERIINGYCEMLPIGRFESLDNESTWQINIKEDRP